MPGMMDLTIEKRSQCRRRLAKLGLGRLLLGTWCLYGRRAIATLEGHFSLQRGDWRLDNVV